MINTLSFVPLYVPFHENCLIDTGAFVHPFMQDADLLDMAPGNDTAVVGDSTGITYIKHADIKLFSGDKTITLKVDVECAHYTYDCIGHSIQCSGCCTLSL